MRGKTQLRLSKEVKVPESAKIVYSQCQINRSLYISVKQDNLITLRVRRFPNLFSNLNWFIFVCKETDICDIDIYLYLLIFIPPSYF